MGIMLVYQTAELTGGVWFGLPYFSIALSLNILLTLMIVVRLILHTGNIRTSMGNSGTNGLYRVIVTMLVESSALYAVSSLLVLGPSSAGNSAADIFIPILSETQVCPFLRPYPLGRLSDVMMDWTGHRSTAHHSASRQEERVDERDRHFWTYRLTQICNSKEVYVCWWSPPYESGV